MIVLSSAYLGSILHYSIAQQKGKIRTECHESFVKQSHRSRCEIYGANGLLKLSIPIQKWANQTPVHQIQISYLDHWQDQHWRSIESAYRASPYFEFYEDDIKPYFESQKTLKLLDFNRNLEKEVKSLLKLDFESIETKDFQHQQPDYRHLIQSKNKTFISGFTFPEYIQVFDSKHGFLPNLSILDLLFNLGPESKSYLESIDLSPLT